MGSDRKSESVPASAESGAGEPARAGNGLGRRLRRWPGFAGLGLLVAWAALAFALGREWQTVDAYAWQPSYVRVKYWLRSAECMQRRGAFLAVCDYRGRLKSIEDAQGADDLGHALLANTLAWGRATPVTRRTLTRLNVVLNATGLLGLSIALWLSELRLVAVLAVLLGLRWGIPGPYPGPDTLGAFLAAYCLAWVPVLWISRLDLERVTSRRGLVGGALSVVSLTGAVLLRQPIGLAGVAGALTLLAWQAASRRPSSRRGIAAAAGLALVLLLPTQAARGLVTLRSWTSDVPAGQRLVDHGISHNLYIGLGVYPNPWGIEWLDENARDAVARLDPSIDYATPAYFRALWRLYLGIVWRDPIGVAHLYWRKTLETLTYEELAMRLPATLALLGSAWWWLAGKRRAWLRALVGSTILVLLVLLQGVLAKPWWPFFYPAAFGVQVVLLGLLEAAGLTLFDRWRPAATGGGGYPR